jgi:uncharacterized protein DUF1553/uncharacterized protein DUF1549
MVGAACLLAAALRLSANDDFFTPQKKAHWAWQPPRRPVIPVVKNSAWVQNPIDAFVLAKLEERGLRPSPPAEAATLLRRMYFDLIGLPPTSAEVERFVAAWNATSAKKQAIIEETIDRLLTSSHYGERWGRHWLDLARYADSNGYEFDEIRPDAWRYRDYVIRSFNANKPYDRFLLEQLAGDELFPDDPDARIATGFNLLGPDMTDSSNQAQRRQNTLDDMTETTGLVFLGMTVGCARCHDHKFEPILQADFYRLQSFFTPTVFRRDVPVASKEQLAVHVQQQKHYQELIQPTLTALAQVEEPYRAKVFESKLTRISDEAAAAHRTPEAKRSLRQRELVNQTERLVAFTSRETVAFMNSDDRRRHEKLEQELASFDKQKPAPLPVAMALEDMNAVVPKTYVLERGELNHRGEEVRPGWPVILSPGNRETSDADAPGSPKLRRRAALARWIADPQHPLSARVMVNRLWHYHFGRGIVATPSDFGLRGEAPTHPELLDWLATEFVARGWSIKAMHRLMMTSAAYQQDSRLRLSDAASAKPQAAEVDPDNLLLWRMNRRRLEGEIIRDGLLAISGRLNPKMGGPGVFVPLPPESRIAPKDWPVTANPKEHERRSVYLFARRNLRLPFLEAFDLPDSNQSCPKRQQSVTGPQALALLNGRDVAGAASALAKRLYAEAATTDERVSLGFQLAFARKPNEEEMRWSREFLQRSALEEFCRALLNANEFITID